MKRKAPPLTPAQKATILGDSSQRRYSVTYVHTGWQAIFEIDVESALAPCMESLNFFGDPITREDDSPEETIRAFLLFWAPTICRWSMERLGGVPGIIKESTNWEGLFALDGSKGVKLLECDRFLFDYVDFETADGKASS